MKRASANMYEVAKLADVSIATVSRVVNSDSRVKEKTRQIVLSAMHKLAGKIKSGTVWGNCHGVIDTVLPFGGYKESGLGREQGQQGLEVYQETKTVIIQL